MMKVFLQVSVVFVLGLIGLGSAIRCYSCTDYTGSCTASEGCGAQHDGCLTLNERNGKIYRQCIKYSDCKSNILGTLFPKVASMSFSCCSDDLCNGASVTAARTSVLGLLLSLALFWWCIF